VFTARYGLGIYIIQGRVHVRSALGRVAQGQVFLRAVLLVAVSTIPPLLLSVRLIPEKHWTE
jgi:hypothetical protein